LHRFPLAVTEPAPETSSELPAVDADAERLALEAQCIIGLHLADFDLHDDNRLANKDEVLL
jgi:hypothetical protein